MSKEDALNNYYKDLPEGFEENYAIDAKKTKVGVILNLVALALMVVSIVACWGIKFGLIAKKSFFQAIEEWGSKESFLIMVCVGIFLYLIVHELTHGLVYKCMTKQKLTFGLTATVAYCGLKEGFVNKKTAIFAILAPFVLYSVIFLTAICLIPANAYCAAMIMIFSIHFGGCAGDLYGAAILIFKYRGKRVLMNDTGPKQTFYLKNS